MSRKLAAVLVAVVVGLAASGIGVARATTGRSASGSSPAVVKACRTSSGYLVLPTSHHACTHGARKVSLDVPGVRGPQGLQGARGVQGQQGVPGPEGPGARTLSFAADSATTGPTVALDGWSYHFVCATSGGGWTTSFVIAAPSGTTFNLYTVTQQDHNESGTLMTGDGHSFHFGGFTATLGAGSANSFRNYEEFYLDGSDGTSQHVSLVWSADAHSTLPSNESNCMAAGQVVPAS